MSKEMVSMGRDDFVHGVVLRGGAMTLWSKHESQETLYTKLANAGLVGTPWVC
jgi:hypothetical protein